MVAAVIVAMVFVTAFIGDAGQGWAERGTMTAVLFTGLWCVAAATAGAVGAWQAAERGAPHIAAARFAGAFGPGAADRPRERRGAGRRRGIGRDHRGRGASSRAAAAVAGADALARRLEAGW